MRLGLSSAAAPDASFEELLAACARRGFQALELRAGDWHGVDLAADPQYPAVVAERARENGVTISAYVAEHGGSDLRMARLSEALDVPVLVPAGAGVLPGIERAAPLAAVGAHVAILIDGAESDGELDLLNATAFDVAWDADPAAGELGACTQRLLERFGARLRHIRLQGGGPEAAMQDGRGIGEMMRRLGLAAFDGSLVVAPSSPRYRVIWETWLGRRGGSGCAGTGADAGLVDLVIERAATKTSG